jgi:hypothetical protein
MFRVSRKGRGIDDDDTIERARQIVRRRPTCIWVFRFERKSGLRVPDHPPARALQ